jgi:hypothetical protein
MRTIPHDPDDETFARADWKEAPHAVLDTIDKLLAPFGLEVVMTDSDSDTYHFTVERREP